MTGMRMLGGLAIALVCALAAAWFFLPDVCSNKIIAEYPSPDGQQKLVVFQRGCGATTGFSTQASLRRASKALGNGAGDTFVSDTNNGGAPSSPGGGPSVKVVWESNNSLSIAFNPLTRVFKSESSVRGVRIRYVPEPDAVQPGNRPDSK